MLRVVRRERIRNLPQPAAGRAVRLIAKARFVTLTRHDFRSIPGDQHLASPPLLEPPDMFRVHGQYPRRRDRLDQLLQRRPTDVPGRMVRPSLSIREPTDLL